MKKINDIILEDLESIKEGGYELTLIWGRECMLLAPYFLYTNKDLSPFWIKIKSLLSWFEANQETIKSGVSDKYWPLTKEWIEGEESYNDISKDDFLNSIILRTVGFCIGKESEEPWLDIYLGFEPDYFLGHVICCYIKYNEGEIIYNLGLEG